MVELFHFASPSLLAHFARRLTTIKVVNENFPLPAFFPVRCFVAFYEESEEKLKEKRLDVEEKGIKSCLCVNMRASSSVVGRKKIFFGFRHGGMGLTGGKAINRGKLILRRFGHIFGFRERKKFEDALVIHLESF